MQQETLLPDLVICDIDLLALMVAICNKGTKSVPVNFLISWGQASEHAEVLWLRWPFIFDPGMKIWFALNTLDEDMQIIIDADGRIREIDENNNCILATGNSILCHHREGQP